MEIRENSSDIKRLLGMKGEQRLGVNDEIVEKILEIKEKHSIPGVTLRFLESKYHETEQGGDWSEYKILYKVSRLENSVRYAEFMFSGLTKLMSEFKDISNISTFGVDEVLTEEPSYYVLFYILKDGKKEIKS